MPLVVAYLENSVGDAGETPVVRQLPDLEQVHTPLLRMVQDLKV